MSSAIRRTTTIRRSYARDRILLVLPGVVLCVGLVLMLRSLSPQEQDRMAFSNFVSANGVAATDQAEIDLAFNRIFDAIQARLRLVR